MANQLNTTDLDFDKIKANLKSYFTRSDSPYRDWNFDGSGLNMMLDVLAYNTHYNAILTHMAVNESFIDSAQLRKNVVSHAKLVGYTPTSIRASRATLNLILTGPTSDTLVLPRGTQFSTVLDGVAYTFSTLQDYSAPGPTYTFTHSNGNPIELIEGSYRILKYTADNSLISQKFVIDDIGADMSTLKVRVREHVNSTNYTTYTKYGSSPYTSLETLDSNSTVYFLYENLQGKYEVSFGNGIYGKLLGNLNIVELEYISTHGSAANGASDFTLIGYPNLSVVTNSTISIASGGASQEGIESIRFNAPISIVTQNRAVTADDYRSLILKDFTNIQSINVWGGEDADPPEYGKVFIAIKPNGANALTDNEKQNIIGSLKTKKIVTISPEFVDPDFTYITLEIFFKYNSNLTQYTLSELETLVRSTVSSFNITELQQFDNVFRYSKFLRAIDSSDPAILNSYARVYVYKTVNLSSAIPAYHLINFNCALVVPTNSTESVISSNQFLISGAPVALADEPISGDLVNRNVYIYNTLTKEKVNTSVGILNPETGSISLAPFAIDEDITLSIASNPISDDLAPRREQLLSIDINTCSIVGEVDTIAISGAAGIANYNTFSRAK